MVDYIFNKIRDFVDPIDDDRIINSEEYHIISGENNSLIRGEITTAYKFELVFLLVGKIGIILIVVGCCYIFVNLMIRLIVILSK